VGFWLALVLGAAALAVLLWYMVAMPGRSWPGALPALGDDERRLAGRLRTHVQAIGAREHNAWALAELEAAAAYIERELTSAGHAVRREEFQSFVAPVRNVLVEVTGTTRPAEIVLVGAHYDSVRGAPGANDNGSGVAAVLELARAAREWRPARTWRFVLFVNEEPPFYKTGQMGSRVHAARARARGERIVAMYSLETIGWYSDAPGSQKYPFPFSWFYPDRGDFLAFVGNLPSRGLLHATIAAFRTHAQFPSDGLAAPAFIPGVDWSDHGSFWEAGYPALMVTDTAPYRYPHYHTAQDTPDKVDYERLAHVVRGLERTFRALDATLP
jgi:Zn-dependent M28 family amino/carboxypeptidase